MDSVIGLSERSQHPRNFKGDGYIPKGIEDAWLRQVSETLEHRWTL